MKEDCFGYVVNFCSLIAVWEDIAQIAAFSKAMLYSYTIKMVKFVLMTICLLLCYIYVHFFIAAIFPISSH